MGELKPPFYTDGAAMKGLLSFGIFIFCFSGVSFSFYFFSTLNQNRSLV